MNIYELMFILDQDLGKEAEEKFFSRFEKTIAKNGGNIIRMDDQGVKYLAYKINKKPRGHYFLGYLEGPGSMLAEVERFLRINEDVVRFILVKQDAKATRADFEPKAEKEAPAETEKEAPAEVKKEQVEAAE